MTNDEVLMSKEGRSTKLELAMDITSTSMTALLLGETSTADMRSIEQTVRALIPADRLRVGRTASSVAETIADGWVPDVVVVAQNWSDEYPVSDVQKMLAEFPLARWYVCFGPWCDSDGRTRDLWPLAVRIRAAEASARLRQDFAATEHRMPLPWTASRSEIFEELANRSIPAGLKSLRVAVVSPDRAWHDLWHCVLRRAGCQILSRDELSRAQAIVWDADPWSESRAGELSTFHSEHPQVRVLAAVGWFSADLADAVQQHGAAAVICKISSVSEILQSLVAKRV